MDVSAPQDSLVTHPVPEQGLVAKLLTGHVAKTVPTQAEPSFHDSKIDWMTKSIWPESSNKSDCEPWDHMN